MQHGITQCYLPPGRSDIPAFTPAEAGTRFNNPGGMQGRSGVATLRTANSATPEGCKAVAVWQPYELLYTCYLLTYSLFRVQAQSSEGERAFSVTGPTACNSLLYDIRKITYTNALKHHLIFYFFNHYFYI